LRVSDEHRWRDLFEAVLNAPDNNQLERRINQVQEAIERRIEEAMGKMRAREKEQLCQALQTLKLLQLKLHEGKPGMESR
jgi:hypothetical protein